MGCCQSENRLDDFGYLKTDIMDKKLYLYSKQPQTDQSNYVQSSQQNMQQTQSNDRSQQDQLYQDRNALNIRYRVKQLSEIREDQNEEQSMGYDGSQTKSAKSNRFNDLYGMSDGFEAEQKEHSFYKAQCNYQVADAQPFYSGNETLLNNQKIVIESPQRTYIHMENNTYSGYPIGVEEMYLQKQQIIQI